jgi:hypothetical protein
MQAFSFKVKYLKITFRKSRSPFSGAFAKLRKVTIRFVMSVRLSIRMKQVGSHWTDFHDVSEQKL